MECSQGVPSLVGRLFRTDSAENSVLFLKNWHFPEAGPNLQFKKPEKWQNLSLKSLA
jgi:hypothetical protein